MERNIHRGDIFWIDFPHDSIGSEIKKVRPAVVVSNDKNNLFSPNIEICYLTTAEKKKPLPTHVEILLISTKNTVLCENVYTISKERLGNYIATLEPAEQARVDRALLVSLGLSDLENSAETQKSVQSAQQPEQTEELKSVKKCCIELQAQNKLYHQLLSCPELRRNRAMLIYLDYAATAPVLQTSLRVFNHRCLNYTGNPNSIHARGTIVNADLEEHKKIVAACLNCDPEQVIFTSSATESCRLAINALQDSHQTVACSDQEHESVAGMLPVIHGKAGKNIAYVHLHTNNETGFIYGLENTVAWNVCFSDCTAAMGKYPLNYKSDAIDYIAGGGHKFGAPVGVGVLIAKEPEKIYELEHFATPSNALAAAFSQALWFRTQHLAEFAEMAGRLHDRLIDGIMNEIPDAKLNGSVYEGNESSQSPYIANISFPGVENTALVLRLSSENVMVSGGAACSSGDNKPSRVLLASGYPEERARSAVRFSFDYTLRLPMDEYQPNFGAEQEKDFSKIDRAVKLTAQCVKELKNLSPNRDK